MLLAVTSGCAANGKRGPNYPTAHPSVLPTQTNDPTVVPTGETTVASKLQMTTTLVAIQATSIAWKGPLLALYPEDLTIYDTSSNQLYALLEDAKDINTILGWSVDGCQLAYRADSSMYVINVGTYETRRLLTGYKVPSTHVLWSPDGKWIAYDAGSPQEIYVMQADGTNLTQLTQDEYVDSIERWAPDGHTILYWSRRSEAWELYTVDTSTRMTQKVISLPSKDFLPDLSSPDNLAAEVMPGPLSPNQQFAVVIPYKETQSGWFSQLYLINISTGVVMPVYDKWLGLQGIEWSPNGKSIAIGANYFEDGTLPGVYLIDVASGNKQLLAANSAGNDVLGYPSWSPDGGKLAILGSPSPWLYDFGMKRINKLIPDADLSTPVQWYSPMLWSPRQDYDTKDCQ